MVRLLSLTILNKGDYLKNNSTNFLIPSTLSLKAKLHIELSHPILHSFRLPFQSDIQIIQSKIMDKKYGTLELELDFSSNVNSEIFISQCRCPRQVFFL